MALGGPPVWLGKYTEQPASCFTCPNCGGNNGVNHFFYMGFASDGPWVTRCTDCGYCDRCGRADSSCPTRES